MEGALFIGEADLARFREAILLAQTDADAARENVRQIAKMLGVCLDHATLRTECGCTEGEASKASAAQRPPDSSVAETPEEEH